MCNKLYNYNQLKTKLIELSDENYKKFNQKLIPGIEDNLYGVKIPNLRILAKEILKQDWREFLFLYINDKNYEIIMICGMVTALAKCDFSEKLKYISDFIPRINNWAICDIFCGSIKDTSKNLEQTYEFLQTYLNSSDEFHLRFAIIMLMSYFITDEYIFKVLFHIENINSDKYYVKMGLAWALSVCFIKYRDKTLEFLKTCHMDKWTYNKAIQKMLESYRVSAEDKKLLKTMKMK